MRLVSASLQTITQLSNNKIPQKTISAWAKQQSARRAMQIWVLNNWTAAYYHILKDIATLNSRKSHLQVRIIEIKQSQLAYIPSIPPSSSHLINSTKATNFATN